MMLNWSKVGKKHEKFNYLHILIKLKKSNLEIDSSNLEGNMSHHTIWFFFSETYNNGNSIGDQRFGPFITALSVAAAILCFGHLHATWRKRRFDLGAKLRIPCNSLVLYQDEIICCWSEGIGEIANYLSGGASVAIWSPKSDIMCHIALHKCTLFSYRQRTSMLGIAPKKQNVEIDHVETRKSFKLEGCKCTINNTLSLYMCNEMSKVFHICSCICMLFEMCVDNFKVKNTM